jgi:hypothetical protein
MPVLGMERPDFHAPVAPPPAQSAGRVLISESVKVFLNKREVAKIAPPTLRKYRTFTRQLTVFAESRGSVMLPVSLACFHGSGDERRTSFAPTQSDHRKSRNAITLPKNTL